MNAQNIINDRKYHEIEKCDILVVREMDLKGWRIIACRPSLSVKFTSQNSD